VYRSFEKNELCTRNVWRGEAENYWHDAMCRLRFFLRSAVKRVEDRRGKTSFCFIKEHERMEFSPIR